MTGTEETGYQTTLPKPRRPVKAAEISSQSEWRATSSGVPMETRRWAVSVHGAGVGDVELKGGAGSERRGERDGGFVELAGVVGVGVEGGDGEAGRRGRRCGFAPS